MKRAIFIWLVAGALCSGYLPAQEANSGLDLRETLSGQFAASNEFTEAPRSGVPVGVGFRSDTYPAWKFNDHWTLTGAWQLNSRPYFNQDFSSVGNGVNGNILQASLNYSRVSDNGSLMIRAGQLSTAFGSFLLRYDDADNAVVDLPLEYGYYDAPVSSLSVAGAEIDGTRGKWDGRAQFANSSPANPRSLFGHDQYGNWAGGGGYTIRQGLRVGASGYRGPYLDRKYQYFMPKEVSPSKLPAYAMGLDASWMRGHWTVLGEVQKFVMPYTLIPVFREQAGYAELKRVLTPRWYIAGRVGYTSVSSSGKVQSYEGTAGFRPNRLQLIKIDYELQHYSVGPNSNENTLAIQYVTSLHWGMARN
jgi:hypothetical protein